MKQESFGNTGAGGMRVENLAGTYSPEAVMTKLKLAANNERFKEDFDYALNSIGMSIEDNPDMLSGLSMENLQKISSLLGDIRFHVQAANDPQYNWRDDIDEIINIIDAA